MAESRLRELVRGRSLLVVAVLLVIPITGCGGPFGRGWGNANEVHKAAFCGDTNTIRKFSGKPEIDAIADVPYSGPLLELTNDVTPLDLGVLAGEVESVKSLVEIGAALDRKNARVSSVQRAIEWKRHDMLELILELGAKPGTETVTGFPLEDAAIEGDDVATSILLAHGAPVDQRSSILGSTALMAAATPHVVRRLIDAGSDVNARDRYGETPLMHASTQFRGLPLMEVLFTAGADVQAVDNNGWNALHYATASADERTYRAHLRALLDHGVGIDAAPGSERETPLMVAAIRARPSAAQLLLYEGADPDLRNAAGETALDIARMANGRYPGEGERQRVLNLLEATARNRK
jgi:hypothetical protein